MARSPHKFLDKWHDFQVVVWEERDRVHIRLNKRPVRFDVNTGGYEYDERYDKDDYAVKVAEWWDEDAQQMFEDGFFKWRDLEASVVDYVIKMGIVERIG